MADKDMIKRELAVLDLEASDYREVLTHMASVFLEKGYVKETYLEAVLAREARYPTAIPLPVESVAIPHTMPEHIVNMPQPGSWKATGRWGTLNPGTTTGDRRLLKFHRSSSHPKQAVCPVGSRAD